MEREKRIQEEHVIHHFGFPVILHNVEMVKIRNYWSPNINMNRLRDLVLLSLVMKKGPLSGNQVRYIRKWLKETLESFGERLGVTHSSIKKWESKAEAPTGTSRANDLYIRMLVLHSMVQAESPVLLEFLHKLSEVSQDFGEIEDVFVFEENKEGAPPLGLSYAHHTVLSERIGHPSESESTTLFDFGALSPESKRLFFSE